MATAPKPFPETGETRARILRAAQRIFGERGYSQARIQDIAAAAGVAPSLVMKYFGAKTRLFSEALKLGLVSTRLEDIAKDRYGKQLTGSVEDFRAEIFAPAMIALSLGDDDARQIATDVINEHIIDAVAGWIGPPDAEARAATLFMVSVAYIMFMRHLNVQLSDTGRRKTDEMVSGILQSLMDGTPATNRPAL